MLVPIQCEYYALEGLGQLLATIDLVRDHLNPRLRLNGVLLTMYDARTTLSADVAAEVRRHLGEHVFETIVPRSVRLAEAPSLRPADRALQPRLTRRPGVRRRCRRSARSGHWRASRAGRQAVGA